MSEDRRPRAEIRRDLDDVLRPSPLNGRARLAVGADIRAAELIDRLLGIAHHEERAWLKRGLLPPPRPVVGGDQEEDFRLNRVGVLELVDKNMPIPGAKISPHRLVLADERARAVEEVTRYCHAWVQRWREEGFAPIRAAWRARAISVGEEIRVRLEAATLHGRFLDIDQQGALLLENTGELRRIRAGEIFPANR